MLNRFTQVREAENTLLRNGCLCDMCPSFIDDNRFLPNRPHESDFFAKANWFPYSKPIKLVDSQEVTLPFVYHLIHARFLLMTKYLPDFCGIVKDVVTFDPLPPIQVPFKCGLFAIEEGDFFLLSLLWPPSGVNDFNMMKDVSEVSSGTLPLA